MISINQHPGASFPWKGHPVSFFSGYSYLSLEQLPSFREYVKIGLDTYGCVFPSSRISNIRLELFEQLEHQLSMRTGSQACCTFPSGFQASQAAVLHCSRNSQVLFGPHCHPALKTLPVAGLSITEDQWPGQAIDMINRGTDHAYTLISDTVDPLVSRVHDFSFLTQVKRPCRVLLDDSHGMGILGSHGEGSMSRLPASAYCSYLLTFSLAKAFAINGGAAVGSLDDIWALRTLPIYTASSSLPPAFAYAWIESIKDIDIQLDKLRKNIHTVEACIPPNGFMHDPQLPIFSTWSSHLYDHMLSHHIMLSRFSYPNPNDPPITRIIIQAAHSLEQLQHLKGCLNSWQGS